MRYLLLIILLQGCNNSINITDRSSENNTLKNSINISAKINPQSLSFEAQNITQKWSSLPELQSIINGLKSENYTAFMETDNYLKEFITELKKTLPKKLNTTSISSRIVVLETNILELESVLSKTQFETKKKVIITNKSIESYYNLIYQINKTIEKELQKITE
ncbi:MAG: hypothetical protein ISR04_04850 [Flavobacteriaceae bacterium]|nr:hypothetical protein [Flavobacteriaceae bacterium]|tara:strand:- start:15 stop:503 length:489 start_codon:yes stop_codon:yes gene_type:complete